MENRCCALAAQLVAFPLCLFYFHQFPNYFLLSNLLVIFLSTIIIYGGITLLLFSSWSAFAKLMGMICGYLVHLLNTIVTGIEHLPHSLIHGISISVLETILIYCLIAGILAWLH